MNVYLIKESCAADTLWHARNMLLALAMAEDAYIAELHRDSCSWDAKTDEMERENYRNEELLSCTLLGELGNHRTLRLVERIEKTLVDSS